MMMKVMIIRNKLMFYKNFVISDDVECFDSVSLRTDGTTLVMAIGRLEGDIFMVDKLRLFIENNLESDTFIKFNKLVFFLMLKINISNIFSKIIISKSVIGILEIYE